MSHIAGYAKVETDVYKVMKKASLGVCVYLASQPQTAQNNAQQQKKVGICILIHHIAPLIVQELGNPIITATLKEDDDIIEYSTDPELIFGKYKHLVDIVIDGGYGNINPSTVIACSQGDFNVIREGMGDISLYI